MKKKTLAIVGGLGSVGKHIPRKHYGDFERLVIID